MAGQLPGEGKLAPGSAESIAAQAANSKLVDQFAVELSGGTGTTEPGGGVLRAKSVANAQGGGAETKTVGGKTYTKVPGGWRLAQ